MTRSSPVTTRARSTVAYDTQVRAADALRRRGAYPEAIQAFHAITLQHPHRADAFSNLAAMLQAAGHPMPALQSMARSLELDPANVSALINSAEILKDFGDWPTVLATYDAARALRPSSASVRFARGLQLLTVGQWAEGWREHEQRFHVPDMPLGISQLRSPRWDGSALAGRHIVLDREQGLGDQIMFARFATDVAERGGRVTVRCSAPLAPLLSRMSAEVGVISDHDAVPRHDVHATLMSLPHWLGVASPDAISGAAYLAPCGEPSSAILQAMVGQGPRVGLVWAGNAQHRNNARRSIAPALLLPLVQIPGVQFVSLQRHDGPGAVLPAVLHPHVRDLGGALPSFNDTAHALRQLDLLITVDTSVAHLAGALGVPTLLLVPFVPDWRWMLDRRDTPWYDSLQLLRQTTLFEWQPVIESAIGTVTALLDTPRPR